MNIACVAIGDDLYVSAGDSKTQWVENMEADPRVRIDDSIYELNARRVIDGAEIRLRWTRPGCTSSDRAEARSASHRLRTTLNRHPAQ
ncbi:MAG: hypothetical protein GY722_23545 [bacterium]|nr:hypothetical protein [bacterium]